MIGDVSIRPATVDDAPALAEMRFRMFEEIAPEEGLDESIVGVFVDYFRRAMPEGRYLAFMAEEDERVVGTAGTAIVDVPPLHRALDGRVARIQSVYVAPGWRRRGVARELLSHTLEAIRGLRITRVALMASDAGKGLYEEFGFQPAQEMVLDLAEEVAEQGMSDPR